MPYQSPGNNGFGDVHSNPEIGNHDDPTSPHYGGGGGSDGSVQDDLAGKGLAIGETRVEKAPALTSAERAALNNRCETLGEAVGNLAGGRLSLGAALSAATKVGCNALGMAQVEVTVTREQVDRYRVTVSQADNMEMISRVYSVHADGKVTFDYYNSKTYGAPQRTIPRHQIIIDPKEVDRYFEGTEKGDTIRGRAGDDFIDGGAGKDRLDIGANGAAIHAFQVDGVSLVANRQTGELDRAVFVEELRLGDGKRIDLATVPELDVGAYVASYADLIRNIGTNLARGATHYAKHGFAEGRHAGFDGLEYIASYADLIRKFGADANTGETHFIKNGHAEGRATTFDAEAYLASHADLIRALGWNPAAAAEHYIEHGFAEGRQVTFDSGAYLASHGDLIRWLGWDPAAATEHYVRHGHAEGRQVTFDGLAYVAPATAT